MRSFPDELPTNKYQIVNAAQDHDGGNLSRRSRLKQNGFEALNQRLRFRYALQGFFEEETAEYIKLRIKSANVNEHLFTEDALKSIFLAAQGIPREINNICPTE